MQDNESRVTEAGNPAMPEGACGAQMLDRMNRSHEDVTNWALDLLVFDAGYDCLDIGCGGGATLRRISRRMGEGCGHVTGVDYSPVSVERSRKFNAADVAAGRMSVIEASVDDLPFADSSFDVVTTVESFYFWPNPECDLAEVWRVLRPGGRFLLVADIYDKPDLPADASENIEKYQLTVLTPEGYMRLFERVGFSSCEVHLRDGTSWIAVEGMR